MTARTARTTIGIGLRVAAFAAITLLLTWLWNEGGRVVYGKLLKLVAPGLYELFGFEGARVGAFRQRYVNFIPFVGLVLVTPRLSPRRRLVGLAVGLFVLFCGHLALNLTAPNSGGRHLPLVPSLLSDTLPFLLWLFVAAPAWMSWLPGKTAASFAVAEVRTPPPASSDASDRR
jgi:hypothetical protein